MFWISFKLHVFFFPVKRCTYSNFFGLTRMGKRGLKFPWDWTGLPGEAGLAPVAFCWEQSWVPNQHDGDISSTMERRQADSGTSAPKIPHPRKWGLPGAEDTGQGTTVSIPGSCNLSGAQLGCKGMQKSTSEGEPGSRIQSSIYNHYIL